MYAYLSFQGVFMHSDQMTRVLVAMQGEYTHSMVMEDEEGCKGGMEGERKEERTVRVYQGAKDVMLQHLKG